MTTSRRGFTLVELVLVSCIIGVLAAILLPALFRATEAANRASCQQNLAQLGVALYLYAEEDPRNRFPHRKIHDSDGTLSTAMIFEPALIIPQYLDDPQLLWCPSSRVAPDALSYYDGTGNPNGRIDPEEIDDVSYQYNGWLIMDAANVLGKMAASGATALPVGLEQVVGRGVTQESFAPPARGSGSSDLDLAMRTLSTPVRELDMQDTPWGELAQANVATNGAASDQDFEFKTFTGFQVAGGNVLHRLQLGVERFLVTDSSHPLKAEASTARIPIMWDTSGRGPGSLGAPAPYNFSHIPGGANILFMDGHVEFSKYPNNDLFVTSADGVLVQEMYGRVMDGF